MIQYILAWTCIYWMPRFRGHDDRRLRVGRGSRRRRRRRRVEVDKHLAVADLGLEGLERDEAGRLRRLAARHVERAEVEAALDHVAVEGAVGEVGDAVGAARLGGVVGAVDVVDRDELVADLAADDAFSGTSAAAQTWISAMALAVAAVSGRARALAARRKVQEGPVRWRAPANSGSGPLLLGIARPQIDPRFGAPYNLGLESPAPTRANDMSARSYIIDDREKKTFLLDREVLVSEDILRQEMSHIFGRCWIYVGHASELKKPGDFRLAQGRRPAGDLLPRPEGRHPLPVQHLPPSRRDRLHRARGQRAPLPVHLSRLDLRQ